MYFLWNMVDFSNVMLVFFAGCINFAVADEVAHGLPIALLNFLGWWEIFSHRIDDFENGWKGWCGWDSVSLFGKDWTLAGSGYFAFLTLFLNTPNWWFKRTLFQVGLEGTSQSPALPFDLLPSWAQVGNLPGCYTHWSETPSYGSLLIVSMAMVKTACWCSFLLYCWIPRAPLFLEGWMLGNNVTLEVDTWIESSSSVFADKG